MLCFIHLLQAIIAILSLSDLRALAISLRRVVYFLDSFKNFRSLDFLVRKDYIISYKEKETWQRE